MKKLKYVGDGTMFVPTFGANADWYGDDDVEIAQRTETGLWVVDDSYDDGTKSKRKSKADKAAEETAAPVVEVVEVAPAQNT